MCIRTVVMYLEALLRYYMCYVVCFVVLVQCCLICLHLLFIMSFISKLYLNGCVALCFCKIKRTYHLHHLAFLVDCNSLYACFCFLLIVDIIVHQIKCMCARNTQCFDHVIDIDTMIQLMTMYITM